jgi:putative hydrolase of the HAD superfamily
MSRGALPRPPAAVTFDCWNTLLFEPDWRVAHAHRVDALVRTVAAQGGHVTRDDAAVAFDRAWTNHMDEWRAGRATGAREVAHDALALLGRRSDGEGLEHLVREYENASHSGRVLALDGARDALARLRRAGVRCGLICDTGLTPGRVVRLLLAHHGLLEHLEVQIFSDEQGVPKPDPLVFHAALASLDAPPDQSVHIGDLRRTDVAGARSVGMASLRIRARHDDESGLPEADAVVDSYGDVLALLLGTPG